MTLRLTFELTLLSDYHVGAGQRAGYTVDSTLLRNHRGTPVLRGTLLNGLLRDGLADLDDQIKAAGIQSKRWQQRNVDGLTERLFGKPGQRKLWRYRSSTLTKVNEKTEKRWGSQDAARVRIDPRTRRAKPQQLFIQEEGDSRLTFHFTATCPGATEQDRQDAAVLVAAARLVRHLGAARRRGRGECRLHLVDATGFVEQKRSASWTEAGLKAFRQYWLEGQEMPVRPKATDDTDETSIKAEAKRFRILVRLQEPVLIADKSQKANAFETLMMIPGSAVLGALATNAARRLGIADVPDEDHKLFTQMFIRGGVKVTGLLPVHEAKVGTLYPTITTPLSWTQCETHPQYGDGVGSSPHKERDQLDDRLQKCPVCGAKLKEVGGFLTLQKHVEAHTVERREEIHIQMERETGRVNEGDLFTYIMIDGGQWFAGEITCDAASWPHFTKLTGLAPDQIGEMLLGKAVRRGYGLAYVYLQEMAVDAPPVWTPQKLEERVPENKEGNVLALSLLLLTDAIVLDKWGRYCRRFDETLVDNWLGVSGAKITDQIVKSRRIDTFNTYRQIPGWRDEAMVAGSVVRFTVPSDQRDTLLKYAQQLERTGVGLRTPEGFGQIAINHSLLIHSTATVKPIQLNDTIYRQLVKPTGDDHEAWAEANFREKWTRELDQSQAKNGTWGELKAIDGDLARLIFLYRHRSLDELRQWLKIEKGQPTKLAQSSHLWGDKQFVARTKTSQIKEETLKLVNKLLDELENWPEYAYSIGLEMLAERIGAQVEENEGGTK